MLDLATIAFNSPRLIQEQIRLIRKNLLDEHRLLVIDNSNDRALSQMIREQCRRDQLVWYCQTEGHSKGHDLALNEAWGYLDRAGASHIGFIDHDIFPTCPTTVIDKIDQAGFYGVGQRHGPTDHLYLWPGFCFFSREWLAGRQLDFGGIRGEEKKDDGDTGSMNWPLFADVDWEHIYTIPHGYEAIRKPDDYGLQSWGLETIGDWTHFSNGSHWMQVPAPEERDRLLFERLATL